MKVSRILHAGYVFESGSSAIAFDPIFENPFSHNCYPFPKVEFRITELRFDAVFISHHHDDHCSLESLNLLDRRTPIYIYCVHEELLDWIRELGFRVYAVTLNETITIGEFQVAVWPALDLDVDSIFQIRDRDSNVLNVVDSWIDPGTFDRLCSQPRFDLVLWPFQTMREIEVLAPQLYTHEPEGLPHEWLEQLERLRPRAVVPSSCQFMHEEWSWYNHALFPISYKNFAEVLHRILPETEVWRLNPGQSLEISKNALEFSTALSWITPVGEQDVDYSFDPKPLATVEMARKFPLLTEAHWARVKHFLKDELRAEAPRPFRWRLSIFDGESEHIHDFRIADRVHASDEGKYDWKTEISAFKLYSALVHGESLTSLYLRVFPKPGEDVLDDPLIVNLFNREFGAYQKAQLTKIKAQGRRPSPKTSPV